MGWRWLAAVLVDSDCVRFDAKSTSSHPGVAGRATGGLSENGSADSGNASEAGTIARRTLR